MIGDLDVGALILILLHVCSRDVVDEMGSHPAKLVEHRLIEDLLEDAVALIDKFGSFGWV